jgi:hypothetical protein
VTKLALAALLVLAAVSVSSAPAGGPAACAPTMLSGRVSLQGATGAMEGGVTVTNRKSYTCMLYGRAGVVFLHRGAGLNVRRVAGASTTGRRDLRALVISTGEKAFVRLRWSNWCGKHYSHVPVLVSLRARQPRLIAAGEPSTPPCLERSAGSVVAVGPWERR